MVKKAMDALSSVAVLKQQRSEPSGTQSRSPSLVERLREAVDQLVE